MQAAAAGDMATAATIVGEAVDLVRSSRPAAAILTAMEEEAIELLSRAPDILVSRG
jgi:hypothetical protein